MRPPAAFRVLGVRPGVSEARLGAAFRARAFVTPDAFLDLAGSRRVGELGRHRSLAEVRALQALWVELHARAQEPGGAMGDWLRVDRFRLFGWHPRCAALLGWTVGLSRARDDCDPAELARALVELALDPRGGELARS